ncbi:hypothetical protein [Chondrinema litorale]|uniref:hypothetical protein n=1 Tax=Chondrinema litorale TaxID=2994555 RepID=UPI0025432119|nr:hypothetical protein [Chondrinema litorale]UZR94530.1 hypothetical protein OQ292_01685 [Chondrinema litorale]
MHLSSVDLSIFCFSDCEKSDSENVLEEESIKTEIAIHQVNSNKEVERQFYTVFPEAELVVNIPEISLNSQLFATTNLPLYILHSSYLL